jgi:hypothetical protein
VSDEDIQSLVLQLTEEAVRLYTNNSGMNAPECFIQSYCAAELMKRGWVVTIETNATEFKYLMPPSVKLDPDLARFAIDLVLYDRSPLGNPDEAPTRALIEFKSVSFHVEGDMERTKRLLSKLNPGAFGFVVAHPSYCFDRPDFLKLEIEAARQIGPCTVRRFDQPIGNGKTLHGAAIGFPVQQSTA